MKTTQNKEILEEIPDYGDLFTIEEFEKDCKSGGFIDYDGTGYYAFKNKMTNKEISCDSFVKGTYDKNYTHVMWFNK